MTNEYPAELAPILEAIADRAARLCESQDARIFVVDGDTLRYVAGFGDVPFPIDPLRPLSRGLTSGRAVMDRAVVHVEDLAAAKEEFPEGVEYARRYGHRTTLAVPLVREDKALGVILLRRSEVRPFNPNHIELVKAFADQAAVAIENLRLSTELKTRNAELNEALEQQTATTEILKVISSSPTDIQPVLDAVVRTAARLCNASDVIIRRVDGELLRVAAHIGPVPILQDAAPIRRGTFGGRAVLERRTIHVHDALDPQVLSEYPEAGLARMRSSSYRTILVVPLIREGDAIGTIAMRRPEVRPFSDKQIKLLETFAAQAVIGIENVRLFNETREALEQQIATAEILRVISGSPSDIQPVLDAVAESAARLCAADDVVIRRADGDVLRLVAHIGSIPVVADVVKVNRGTVPGCSVVERRTIHIHDVFEAHARGEYPEGVSLQRGAGDRTFLAVPLLREDVAVGVIVIRRTEVRPFDDKQIRLLETFAAQAVIAIENVRLFNETKEALEQQTATAEILKVISRSPSDIQPVLDAVAENAARLCGADDVMIRQIDGDSLRLVAHLGPIETVLVLPMSSGSAIGRAVSDRRTIHIHDSLDDQACQDYPDALEVRRRFGIRTMLAAPLLREGTAVGAIGVRRREVRPFTEREIKLLETFAAQAAIAIENVRLFNETKEALEQQTATAEILKVISSSPTDVQPVFDAIVKSGRQLFRGMNVSLRVVKGAHAVRVASTSPIDDPIGVSYPANDDHFPGIRAMLSRDVVQVADIVTEEWVSTQVKRIAELRGWRALLAAPMLREDNAIGFIAVTRIAPGPFADKEIALVKTFADQAVIAIENVRLFKELQARNAEITEALEQQTATAEILKVISSSPTDIEPVFNAILESATRLCDAHMGNLILYDGERFQTVAQRGATAEYARFVDERGPFRPLPNSNLARMISERRPIQITDRKDSSAYRDRMPGAVAMVELGGARSYILVPMLKEGRVVGGIGIYRPEVHPFTQKQIDLVSTFASQAVIAIENVRLFNETKEALEQQTATAEILKVISSSPTDVQPVFDAIVKSGARLFRDSSVMLRLVKEDCVEQAARSDSANDDSDVFRVPLGDERFVSPRAIMRREIVHVPDILAEAWPSERMKERAEQKGWRAILCAPMLRECNAIGTIAVTRPAIGPFTDKEIALLKTFADQAVIAIENVRLFRELQERNAEVTESLEQQTATAEILKVISSSPTDVQPVFDAIVKSAVRLCGSSYASLRLIKGGQTELVASVPAINVGGEDLDASLSSDRMPSTRAILRREVIQVPDVFSEEWVDARIKRRAKQIGYHAVISAPMLRDNEPIGAINVTRPTAGPFTDKQVALLKTFADQAVIAIENVRLFKELQARNAEITESLEQQTATSEILRVISSSPTDLQPVFDSILEHATRLCDAHFGLLGLYDGETFLTVAQRGANAEFAKWLSSRGPFKPRESGGALARMIAERQPVHIPDHRESPAYRDRKPVTVAFVELGGARTYLAVPMLKDGRVIGAITIYRPEVRPFTQKQIDLLSTFANQAVIAIENVRLFKELQARNAEVTEALDQQTAMAEILKVISSSPTDLQPVFNAILEKATRLCDAHFGVLGLYDGVKYQHVAHRGGDPDFVAHVYRGPFDLDTAPTIKRMVTERQAVHIPDLSETPGYKNKIPTTLATYELGRARSILAVPMLKEGRVVGGIFIYRPEVKPFTQKQIDLVSAFCSQAVIAIENVRLFKEIQEKGRQLEAANKHKSEFLANMSHELRTPLNAVIGFSDLLLEKMFGEMNAKQENYIRNIQSSGKHLLSLINDILDLSKIEAGRMELDVSAVHIPSALQNAMMLIRERAQRQNVELSCNIDSKVAEIPADERKFKQIVLNLLTNAVKFTPEGGRVDVDVRLGNGNLEVSVKDTGVGIAAQNQQAVFEEFRQVGRQYSGKQEGTGLGLALTRRFVELHGGTIRLQSALGKGSTFTFTIPVRQ